MKEAQGGRREGAASGKEKKKEGATRRIILGDNFTVVSACSQLPLPISYAPSIHPVPMGNTNPVIREKEEKTEVEEGNERSLPKFFFLFPRRSVIEGTDAP